MPYKEIMMSLFIRSCILFLFLLHSALFASVGKVSLLKGDAFVQRDIVKSALKNDAILEEKDIITTDKDAQIQLIFEDKTVVTLGSESELRIDEYLNNAQQSKVKFKFNQGTFKTITGQIGKIAPESFKIETKTAAIGIRGTWIKGKIEPDGDTIGCLRGSIFVQSLNGGRLIEVIEGHKTFVGMDKEPSNPTLIGDDDFKDKGELGKLDRKNKSGDYALWGYWGGQDYRGIDGEIQDLPLNAFVDPNSQPTPTSYIASLIALAPAPYTYQGSVLGSTMVGASSGAIINNGTNTISLTVEFGMSTIFGSMTFNSTQPQAWTHNISGTLAPTGFSGTVQALMGASGTITGSFYGPTAGSIGGSFTAKENYEANIATGTFSATKIP